MQQHGRSWYIKQAHIGDFVSRSVELRRVVLRDHDFVGRIAWGSAAAWLLGWRFFFVIVKNDGVITGR